MSTFHPILQELPTDQKIGGASGAQMFHFLAYGKGNSKSYPYNVVNEKVASELARVVGLPVPEVLLYKHREEWLFLSRAVEETESGESKPPSTSQDVADAVNNRPGIIEEMVCLDLFVCNNDRNPGNLLCDSDKQLWLIDFGNALFYRKRKTDDIPYGIARLESVETDLKMLFDKPHSFLSECHTLSAITNACNRIAAIPDYFVENTVLRLPQGLIKEKEGDFLIEFLNRRKGQMQEIIQQNGQLFANLSLSN